MEKQVIQATINGWVVWCVDPQVGQLRIDHRFGMLLVAGINEHFESWQIDLASGESLVGPPGEGLPSGPNPPTLSGGGPPWAD